MKVPTYLHILLMNKLPFLWLVLIIVPSQSGGGDNPFEWQTHDKFDEITDRMDNINAYNCHSKPVEDLYLPEETLAQMPQFNKLLTSIIYPNRTNVLHVHNMALNRAFYYSYIFQKLNHSHQFDLQPGLMYYYFSAAADVSANENAINGSACFFDESLTYANWYRNLIFNKTLNLYGPRAWRFDDYNDPTNWLREPTNHTIDIVDYGAGPQSNYNNKQYKINEWYNIWLPDGADRADQDSSRKHSYDVGIKYSNETGKFTHGEFIGKTFFGPPSPGIRDDVNLPVLWTKPFFDCGRSNKWIVSATSPVVDHVARYHEWLHIRRHRFVAVSAMDIDFLSIDINPCPIGLGNEPPNYFAGTDRCKSSTMCEPLYGWGFRRGGYQCTCQPGYRYPPWQEGPFQGIDIESATEYEYSVGFDCIPVGLRQVIPIIRGNDTGGIPYDTRNKRAATVLKMQPSSNILSTTKRFRRMIREMFMTPAFEGATKKGAKFVPRYKRDQAHVRKKRQAFDEEAFDRMEEVILRKERVNKDNCHTFKPEELYLPGDVAYNVEKLFMWQARTALRTSHFLSNFLQNIDEYEEYGNLEGDNLLNVEQLFGEVLANVMGDLKLKGSGIFFDIDKYHDENMKKRQFFGPYAYRFEDEENNAGGPTGDRANTNYRAVDFAGYKVHYLDEPWFKFVKERWQSNTYGLTKYTEKPMIRSDLNGTSLRKFELYPMYYYAPQLEDGWWSAPYFDCDGYVNEWIITYSVPFFGLNSIRSALEFKGVVTADVKLDELDISQCPMEFYIPNAFKGTSRCHYESTICVPIEGKKFDRGGYKCECRVGYEYPFNDRAWYFDGQTMEEEYRKLMDPKLKDQSRFSSLRCRIAGASSLQWSLHIVLLLAVIARLFS